MSDLVKDLRLLVPSDPSGACIKAIDEITRLRNELHIAQEWSARVIAGHEEDNREITTLRAENERLRAALETASDALFDTGLNDAWAAARAALEEKHD